MTDLCFVRQWLFACNTFAKAYSASKHSAFGATYFFEFNRTYSPRGYTQPYVSNPSCLPYAFFSQNRLTL
jgi:hypothetical protein